MAWTLAVAAAAMLAAGALFVRVGATLWSRPHDSAADTRAMRAFAVWWIGVGGSTLAIGALDLLALAPAPPLGLAIALRVGAVTLAGAGIAGLLSHALYVYTGRDRTTLLAGIYGIFALAAAALVVATRPDALNVQTWTADLHGTNPTARALVAPFYVAFLLPAVGAGALYLSLVRRAGDAEQRRRILVVGAGVIVWTSAFLLARLSDADLWQFLTRVAIGVLFAALVTWAYAPPSEVDPRWVDEALTRRVRELV